MTCWGHPQRCLRTRRKINAGFKFPTPGCVCRGSVFVCLCQRCENRPPVVALNLTEKKAGVCVYACVSISSKVDAAVYSHSESAVCAAMEEQSQGLFLTAHPGSQASQWALAGTGLSSFHGRGERMLADVQPSCYPYEGSRRCGACHVGVRELKRVLVVTLAEINSFKRKKLPKQAGTLNS